MVLADLKDLEKLFKLCRKQGISEMEIQGIKFKLGELPEAKAAATDGEFETTSDSPYGDFPDRDLTNEELMYYSSGGAAGTAPPEAAKQ